MIQKSIKKYKLYKVTFMFTNTQTMMILSSTLFVVLHSLIPGSYAGVRRDDSADLAGVRRFSADSAACVATARDVHGGGSANAGLNHFLECLMRKTKEEVRINLILFVFT